MPSNISKGAPIDAAKLARARRFRRLPTPSEALAWSLLRGRRLLGLKFRRQQLVAGFVVDFYCPELRLALEIDGDVHADALQAEHDATRTEALASLSIQTLRVPVADVSERRLIDLLTPLRKCAPLS